MASKIVVVGAVDGKFPEVFQKIAILHSKNNFSLAIVAGDLFQDPSCATQDEEASIDALVSGRIEVPVTTYFCMGRHELPSRVMEQIITTGGEVCDNLIFIGKSTALRTSEAIRLVALGGRFDPAIKAGASRDKYHPSYNVSNANTLLGANNADLLITSDWPQDITAGSKMAEPIQDKKPQPSAHHCIAELCIALKPRYHFSTSAWFFEREPYFHLAQDAGNVKEQAVTRFISLAPYGNAEKQKWIYAFSLDSNATPSKAIPAGTTASPFTLVSKKRLAPSTNDFSRYATQNDLIHQQRPKKRTRSAPPGPNECFFCLANPNLATHLVTSIGTDAYLTTAKGPLTTSNLFPGLQFPCHLLIIPLAHAATMRSISNKESRNNTLSEMQRYRSCLNDMVGTRSKGKLGSVTWEISRSSGVHVHWQFVPVFAELIKRGLVEAAFKVEAQNQDYPLLQKSKTGMDFAEQGDYFMVTTWFRKNGSSRSQADNEEGNERKRSEDDGSEASVQEMTLTLALDDTFRFDLQFGRRVLSKLLKLEQRMNWHDCEQTEEEETAEAEAFKHAWKHHDFTIEG